MTGWAGRGRGWLQAAGAAAALAAARLLVLVVPFHLLARHIGRLGAPQTVAALASGDAARARRVAGAIERAARRLPWHSSCLHRALAGVILLRRRRLPATLVLGVALEDGRIAAHAWLRSGTVPVAGLREAAGFTPIARFDYRPRRIRSRPCDASGG